MEGAAPSKAGPSRELFILHVSCSSFGCCSSCGLNLTDAVLAKSGPPSTHLPLVLSETSRLHLLFLLVAFPVPAACRLLAGSAVKTDGSIVHYCTNGDVHVEREAGGFGEGGGVRYSKCV